MTLLALFQWLKCIYPFTEFSHREPWLFVTTSTDNSVKIWDIRMLTDGDDDKKPRKDRFLQSLVHDKAVNSAYFSHVDGTRLLTTDQHRYELMCF